MQRGVLVWLCAALLVVCVVSVGDYPTIEMNQTVTGEFKFYRWGYYRLRLENPTDVLVVFSSDSETANLYVNTNGLVPNSYVYDFRNDTVTGTKTLAFSGPKDTDIFIGIAPSTIPTRYNLTVTVPSACPHDCHGRGYCSREQSQCKCFYGFSGEDCGTIDHNLLPDKAAIQFQGHSDGLTYVVMRVSGLNVEYDFEIIGSGAEMDDIYVSFDAVPTKDSFDYRFEGQSPVADHQNYSITTVSNVDMIYMGIAIMQEAHLNGTVLRSIEADSRVVDVCSTGEICSYRGRCIVKNQKDICRCPAPYSGDHCETVSAVKLGEVYPGSVSVMYGNYYQYEFGDDAEVVARVAITTPSVHLMFLFAAKGRTPTTFDYDLRGTSTPEGIELRMEDKEDESWQFIVFSFMAANYTFTMAQNSSCNPYTCIHGECDQNNICICEEGFSGDNCNISSVIIPSNEVITGRVESGGLAAYRLVVPRGSSYVMLRVLYPKGSDDGSLWLLAGRGSVPTLDSHDLIATTGNAVLLRMAFEAPLVAEETIYFSIYGNPMYLDEGTGLTYRAVGFVGAF